MAFAALTAMAMRKRFGARGDFVFDGAAETTALERIGHGGCSLIVKMRQTCYPVTGLKICLILICSYGKSHRSYIDASRESR